MKYQVLVEKLLVVLFVTKLYNVYVLCDRIRLSLCFQTFFAIIFFLLFIFLVFFHRIVFFLI